MKILIILPNWIGDVVMSLPVLEKSREIFKDSNIKILIRNDIYPLIEENCKFLNISPIFYNKKDFKTTLKIIKKLGRDKFDIAFILPRSYRMFFIAYFSKINKIFSYGDFFKNIFLTKSIKRDKEALSQHRVFYYLNILKLYKNFSNNIKPQLKISSDNIKWSDRFLEENKLKDKIIIGINPGSTYGEAKCWNKDNYLNLLIKLNQLKKNLYFLIFGGKDNIKYNAIFNNIKNSLNLTGKLSLDKSAALIKQCTIFITNDTGPMHIADALEVDIIAIFGPTDPNETPPFTKRKYLLYKQLECSPCKERVCPKNNNECMNIISVDDVFENVKNILQARSV